MKVLSLIAALLVSPMAMQAHKAYSAGKFDRQQAITVDSTDQRSDVVRECKDHVTDQYGYRNISMSFSGRSYSYTQRDSMRRFQIEGERTVSVLVTRKCANEKRSVAFSIGNEHRNPDSYCIELFKDSDGWQIRLRCGS